MKKTNTIPTIIIVLLILVFYFASFIILDFIYLKINRAAQRKKEYEKNVVISQIEKEAIEYIHNTYNCPYEDIEVYSVKNKESTFLASWQKKAYLGCNGTGYRIYYDDNDGWITQSTVNGWITEGAEKSSIPETTEFKQ